MFKDATKTDNGRQGRRYWRSTPMDYLEKIFQIPYHLRPMGEGGFEALVSALTTEAEPEAPAEEAEPETPTEDAEPAMVSAPDDAPAEGAVEDVDAEAGDGVEPPVSVGGDRLAGWRRALESLAARATALFRRPDRPDGALPEAQTGGTDAGAHPTTPEGSAQAGDDAGADAVPDEGGAEAAGEDGQPSDGDEGGASEVLLFRPRLAIAEWERTFMQALHPFIDSPRATKRFVNVYRLIRASHIESPLFAEAGPQAERESGSHPQVLFLLGMLTGFPEESIALFRHMRQVAPSGSWSAYLGALPATPPDRRKRTPSGPETKGGAPEDPDQVHPDLALAGLDPDGWSAFLEAIRRAHSELGERHTSFDPPVSELLEWIPKVSRYSFRSGQALRAPEEEDSGVGAGG